MLRVITFMIVGLLLITLSGINLAQAAGKDAAAKPAPAASPAATLDSGDGAEHVNVDSIKEKYWARGDESEMGVVQNRLYTKAGKFDIGMMGGVFMSDPFLSVKNTGATIGYHFNEYFSAHFLWAKAYSANSPALDTLQGTGQTANYNSPNQFFGIEGNASFLYGKLSLLSKSIIYYDMHLSGGFGNMSVTSSPVSFAGNGVAQGTMFDQSFFTQHLGVGQRFYLSKSTSIRFDYRLVRYSEKIIETVITPQNGADRGSRTNWTNAITLGVDFLLGGAK